MADGGPGDACVADGDCADGYHCDTGTGQCVADGGPGDACVTDGDCADGYHCDTASGQCVADGGPGDACVTDGDCADGYHCDEPTSQCVADGGPGDACVTDGDCADGFHCDEASGLCVADGGPGDACATDGDCAAGYHCDETTSQCVADGGPGDACVADGDCADGYHCDETTSQCVADGGPGDACVADGDCADGYHCDTATGQCVDDGGPGDACVADGDCEDGYHCDTASGLCVADGGPGDACATDGDCAVGYHCDAASGLCVADGGPGDACTADTDCAAGYHCDTTTGQCAADGGPGDACTTDADCGPDYYCDTTTGLCAPGGGLGDPCAVDADCGAALHCDADACAPDEPDGGSCDESSDCASGYCDSGLCCAGGQCCLLPSDCGANVTVCDDPATCQGHREESTCVDSVCAVSENPDDSACDGTMVALDCDPFPDVVCTGAQDQSATPACADSCVDDAGCAAGATCAGGACEPVLCEIAGVAGELVACPLHLVRAGELLEPAVGLQFTLDYDEAALTPESIEVCGPLPPPFNNFACTLGGGECAGFGDPAIFCDPGTLVCSQCALSAIDEPDIALVTGHSVSTCAQPPANCEDGVFPLLFWGTQSVPITAAWADGETIVGASQFAAVLFRLDADRPVAEKVSVSPIDFVATDAAAGGLPMQVRHGEAPGPLHYLLTDTAE